MNEIEQEEILYNKLYEQTKDFGRTHFIKEIMRLQREIAELKAEINKISKKELKVRNMLYSIENGTLTKERLVQIEEVLFEVE